MNTRKELVFVGTDRAERRLRHPLCGALAEFKKLEAYSSLHEADIVDRVLTLGIKVAKFRPNILTAELPRSECSMNNNLLARLEDAEEQIELIVGNTRVPPHKRLIQLQEVRRELFDSTTPQVMSEEMLLREKNVFDLAVTSLTQEIKAVDDLKNKISFEIKQLLVRSGKLRNQLTSVGLSFADLERCVDSVQPPRGLVRQEIYRALRTLINKGEKQVKLKHLRTFLLPKVREELRVSGLWKPFSDVDTIIDDVGSSIVTAIGKSLFSEKINRCDYIGQGRSGVHKFFAADDIRQAIHDQLQRLNVRAQRAIDSSGFLDRLATRIGGLPRDLALEEEDLLPSDPLFVLRSAISFSCDKSPQLSRERLNEMLSEPVAQPLPPWWSLSAIRETGRQWGKEIALGIQSLVRVATSAF